MDISKAIRYFDGNEMAAQVWVSKYAADGEESPDQMHRRMAKEFSRIMLMSDEKYTEEYLYELMRDFKYIVPQGSVMATLGVKGKIASFSNCYVVESPTDSYSGIFKTDEELAQLMKRRGGVGVDISTLRPNGAPVKNAAKTSTGAASFMDRFSSTTREVASKGRRGALMLTISIKHPDAREFIGMKQDRTKVTGANVSVMLTDEFMRSAVNDEDFIQVWPINSQLTEDEVLQVKSSPIDELVNLGGKFAKRVNAKELYDFIVFNAWDNAEPGQIFIDKMHAYAPDGVYPDYRVLTTNPCSEIGMGAYDACRLIAINLFSYVKNPFTPEASFDSELFYKHCYDMQVMGDAIVDLELEQIGKILKHIDESPEPDDVKFRERNLWQNVMRVTADGRRTGCGITALGDTLAALGLKYDSHEAMLTVSGIMRTKLEAELSASIWLASLHGPFGAFDHEAEDFSGFMDMVFMEFPHLYDGHKQYGRRNISWSTIAPTGSLSILTQTSSGLEPMFMPFYTRRRKINPSDTFNRVDFVDQNGDKWMEYPVLEPKFKMWMGMQGVNDPETLTKEEAQAWFEKSPWFGSCANDIDWERRVDMQSVCQVYISHSISSTINIPNSATQEDVRKIYLRAWEKGLKGVTVYRDGCRTGVLVSDTPKEEFAQRSAPKRPKKLDCEVHHTSSSGIKYTVVVGLMDGKPYEVFAISGGHIAKPGPGTAIKEGKGNYKLVQGETAFDLLGHLDFPQEGVLEARLALTRLVSTALRHGAEIKFVVEQLRKSGGLIVSFNQALARVLSKYTGKEILKEVCSSCGEDSLIREEGCIKCKSCGWTKCG